MPRQPVVRRGQRRLGGAVKPVVKKAIKKIAQKAVQGGVKNYNNLRIMRPLIQTKAILNLPYNALFTLVVPSNSLTDNYYQRLFSLNNIFDPDPSLSGVNNITYTGYQNTFGTSAAQFKDGLFQEWTVLQNKWEVTFMCPSDGTPQTYVVGTYINRLNNANPDYATMSSQGKHYKERILGRYDIGGTTIRGKLDMAQYTGSDVRDDGDYEGKFNGTDADFKNIYLYILARHADKSDDEQIITIRLRCTAVVECITPRDHEKGF